MINAPRAERALSRIHFHAEEPPEERRERACATAFDERERRAGLEGVVDLDFEAMVNRSESFPDSTRGDVLSHVPPSPAHRDLAYLMCLLTSLVISNMETLPL